jgi:acyl carrier protein
MSGRDATAVAQTIKDYVLREFLPGEDPSNLTDTTELITTSVLDSLSSLRLVSYLEEEFSISIEAHEADVENLNTIADLTRLVLEKRGG